jgi:transcription elongation factor Elf1
MNFFRRLFLKHCIIVDSYFALPETLEKEYYKKSFTCTNCLTVLSLLVKKGIYIKYAISNVRCTNCGCKVDKEVK